MERHVCDRLNGWQANALSIMDITTLVRSVLSSILVYLLVNTVVPSSYIRELEQLFQNFLWGLRPNNHGLYLIS